MNALGYSKASAIRNAIGTLFARAVSHHTIPDMNEIGFYRMLVRKKHLDKLEEVHRLVGSVQSHQSLSVKVAIPGDAYTSAQLSVGFTNPLDRLLPKTCLSDGIHDENEPELYAKTVAWIDRRYNLGVEFGRLKAVFEQLNGELSSAQQLVFYFEGLTTLLEMSPDEAHKDQAHRLREAKIPGKLPSIAPELRTAARDATKLVARCLLFPKDAVNTSEVSLAFYSGSMGYAKADWSNSGRFEVA